MIRSELGAAAASPGAVGAQANAAARDLRRGAVTVPGQPPFLSEEGLFPPDGPWLAPGPGPVPLPGLRHALAQPHTTHGSRPVSRISRSSRQASAGATHHLEPVTGVEPATCRLQDGCSAN